MAIYRVDDGSVWYFAADDEADARRRWLAFLICEYREKDEAAVLADYNEPTINLVSDEEAAAFTVITDCSGPDGGSVRKSLLDVWREDCALPEEKRAPHGALCNSEWP